MSGTDPSDTELRGQPTLEDSYTQLIRSISCILFSKGNCSAQRTDERATSEDGLEGVQERLPPLVQLAK
jgi:hypothetical protein